MNRVQTLQALFSVLRACNSADSDGECANDLPAEAASDRSTYGHVAAAIESLGAAAEYEEWVTTGECKFS